jgi:tetratricopeptide (TPR) repeat protein
VSQSSNDLSGSVTGPVVQAGHVGSLHLAPRPPVALSGLPPAPPEFTGREEPLRLLASALRPDDDGAVRVSTLVGTAGVGKSALVLKAAHDAVAAGRFPGGVLFIDLQGYDEDRYVGPEAVVVSFLSALGVPDEHFPPTFEARLALYRSKLAELAARRSPVLIVLDNASSSQQIKALLPGDPMHRVLVSSRHTLGDVPGSRIVDVGVLPPGESAELVVRTLRMRRPEDTRAQDEPGAVRDLAALCGHLPLALAVALSMLSADPELSVGELAATLNGRAGRLEELSYGGGATVAAAFELSYARLRPEEARLFRLLALNPGQQASTGAASALAGAGEARARRLLAALREAHMIEPGRRRGWVRFHDLLRLFAERRLDEEEGEDAVESAVDRLLEHYRDAAEDAVTKIVAAARSGRRAEEVEEWLNSDLPNLRGALHLAQARGRYGVGLPLAHHVTWFLRRRQDWGAGLEACETALHFAECSIDEAQHALALYNKGDLLKHMGSYEAAWGPFEEALALYRRLGDRAGEARTLHSLGTVSRRDGRYEAAAACYAAALTVFEELGDLTGTANTLHNLGDTTRRLGDTAAAQARYERALGIYRQLGNTAGEARTRHHLGRVAAASGRTEAAREHWEGARGAYEAAGMPVYAEEVAELLRELDTPDGTAAGGAPGPDAD